MADRLRAVAFLLLAMGAAACWLRSTEPVVVERWQVNPSNIQAFIETRQNRNALLDTDGSHLVAFSGVAEGLSTTDVFVRRYDRGTGQWGRTTRMSGGRGLSRAPVMARAGDAVVVAWISDFVRDGGEVSITVRRSLDDGVSWEEPVTLPVGRTQTRVPQLVSDGETLYMTISNRSSGAQEQVIVFVSSDQGRSWVERRFGDPQDGPRATEPQLAVAGPGRVVLSWFENDREGRAVLVSSSRDAGRQWTDPVEVNDSRLLMARRHCLAAHGDRALLAWTLLDGSQGRVIVDSSDDGGQSWGEDAVLYEHHVSIITPVCKNLDDNKTLVSWSLTSKAVGELGMRILYDVVDAAAKAGGSGVETEKSLVGESPVGRSYQTFDVAFADSRAVSTWATGVPDLGVFVGASSDLTQGFGAVVQVNEPSPQIDSLSPRIGSLDDGRLTLLYNARPASPSPTRPATRLGDLFMAVVELP